jgi:hypothetical protein
MNGERHWKGHLRGVLLAAILGLLLSGCSQSTDQLLQSSLQASREAETAASQQKAKQAMAAVERAAKSLRKLESRAEADDGAKQVVGEARLAVLAAKQHAEIALEHEQRSDRLAGLKVKTYRASRALLIRGFCSGAALGADKIAAQGTNDLKIVDWNLTRDAREFVKLLEDIQEHDSTGEPDWTNVATSLRLWATNPPPEAHVFLALSLLGAGQRDLALAEVEAMGTNKLASPNGALLKHGTRALVYSLNGWSHLAAAEVGQFAAFAPESDYSVDGNEYLVLVHVLVAGSAIHTGDWRKADEHLAACVKLSPNNPITVYLTGERLAANGEWEKAADRMDAIAVTAEDKWLAERFAERARDLRDGKGSTESLILDPQFLTDIAVHYVTKKAKSSEAAAKLDALFDSATAMGKRLVNKLEF